ncbi:MAG: HK97 family phage prohead protease [Pseudomonadota bacterium]
MNKEIKSLDFELKEIDENGTFSGYGSLFWTAPDSYNDVIAQGAFTKTLAAGGRNKNQIMMCWNHNSSSIPGVWTSLTQDAKGLKVEGRLAILSSLGRDLYELMRVGVGIGLSIGYNAIDSDFDNATKIRTLKEIELFEISLVSFPAQTSAGVTGYKHGDLSFAEQILEAAKELNANTWRN